MKPERLKSACPKCGAVIEAWSDSLAHAMNEHLKSAHPSKMDYELSVIEKYMNMVFVVAEKQAKASGGQVSYYETMLAVYEQLKLNNQP